MKFFVNLLVIGGAAAFGYYAEPSLRLELTGIAPVRTPDAPKGDPRALAISKIDLLSYTPDQLPKEVTLKKDAKVTDSVSGTKMVIPAESRVKVVRLENGMVVVSPGATTTEGEVEVTATDIREQLLNTPILETAPEAQPAPKTAAPDMMAKEDPAETTTPAPAPAPTPAPAETAAEPAMKEPTPGSNPALAPEAPAPAADPAAAPAEFTAMAADDIVKAMQDSVNNGGVKAIKFSDASEWTAGEPQVVEGKKVNTGTVSYKSQTFLGVKTIQARAILEGGKVTRWLNAKSGLELK